MRAAGGIVYREAPEGVEVAVIHRPAYDDWSLPKGKLLEGEDEAAAADREVQEETGYRCRRERFVGISEYVDGKGRFKTVRYWLMRAGPGRFVPTREVDELRWLTVHEALALLTRSRDRELLVQAGLGP